MKFLLRPEFLTAVAAWLCALGAHLGWDIPPELVYGGASLVSIAAGGVAVQRNKKNGNGAPKVGMVLLAGMLTLPFVGGCKSILDKEAEVTPKGRFVQVIQAATAGLETIVKVRDAGWLTEEQEAQAKVVTRGVGVSFAAWKAALDAGNPTDALYAASLSGLRSAVGSIEDIVRLRHASDDRPAYTPTEEEIAEEALLLSISLAEALLVYPPDPTDEEVEAALAKLEAVKAKWYVDAE